MRKIRLILTLAPKSFWIALIISLIFRNIGGDYLILSNIIINLLFILIWIKVGVVIHEVGHLTFAKIVGGQPKRLVLGNGNEIFRFELLKIKVIVNSPLRGGFAFASFQNKNFLKLKYFFYISGGFLFNLFFGYSIYILNGFNLDSLSGEYGIDIGTTFILSNALLIVTTLIPFPVTYMGIKLPNDGLNILKLPFKKEVKINEEINTNELFEAFDFFEMKEYDKAIEIYERHLKYDEINTKIGLSLGIMYLKKGEYSKSLDIMQGVINSLDEKQNRRYEGLIYNNIAWVYLILNDIEKADFYSEKAIKLVPKEKSFRGTRGSILIEKGEIENGISLLVDLVNFNLPNSQTMTAAMYLGLAFYFKQNQKEQKEYLRFVENNIDKLEIDDRKLWENIKLKIGPE